MQEGFTIWLTGLSSSGKTSIANAAGDLLRIRGSAVEVLDSGRIRAQINRSLGFSKEEIGQPQSNADDENSDAPLWGSWIQIQWSINRSDKCPGKHQPDRDTNRPTHNSEFDGHPLRFGHIETLYR